MEELTVRGLVVRETDKGDYDKILTLLTMEYGRITVTGKGVKSLKSKNMAASQLFSYSTFLIRRSSKYFYIVESELIEGFYGLKCDLDKLSLASYICDAAAELSVEGMADSELLRLTLNTLFAISNKNIPHSKIKAAFELRASSVAGFQPDLSKCGICGCEYKKDMYLDIMNGRILCESCKPAAEAEEIANESGTARLYMIVTLPVLHAMKYITESSPERFLSFSLDEDELYLLGRVCEAYLVNHIEHSFYTLDFYKSLIL